MKKLHLFVLVFTFSVITTFSQLSFYNYTDPNQITSTEEDGDYFWAGTNGGLYKWFKSGGGLIGKYHNQNGLPSNFVNTIKKDHFYNELWVGTENGVAVKNVLNEWKIYTTADGLPSNQVKSIAFDLSGNKWFATFNGVSKFDPIQKTWTNFTTDNGLPNNFVKAIDIDYQGNVWIGTLNGAAKYDGNTWTKYTTVNGLINNRIYSIATDDTKGAVWFGTSDGVSMYDGYKWSSFNADSVKLKNVNSIAIDANSKVWYGTSFGVTYNPNCQACTWKTYTNADGLASNIVNVVNIDAEGNKWFGNENGISKLSHNGITWTNYITGEGIIDNNIQTIVGDLSNNLWFGTLGGLSKFDGKHWTSFTANKINGLINNSVYSIAIDKNGNKWIGTELGLSHLIYDTTWVNYTIDSGMINNDVLSIVIDRNNKVWCASDSGVSVFNGSTWKKYTADSGLSSSFVHDMALDTAGKIWFATDSGVTYFNGLTWIKYFKPLTITNNKVRCVAVDKFNNKWFGTNNGLTKFNGSTWINYTTSNGLPDNEIQDITFDSYGNLWIATGGGLSQYTGSIFVNYTSDNGLADNDVKSIFISQNTIWVGTKGGVSKTNCEKPILNFMADTTCLPGITSIVNTSSKINSATTFKWDIANNGSIDYTTQSINHNFGIPGIFNVQLIAQNMGCVDSIVKNVLVKITPDVNIQTSGSTTFCNGNKLNLTSIISNSYPQASYVYNWNDGRTSSVISVSESGKYIVTVSDGKCKSIPDTTTINVLQPYASEKICMVTVDSNTGKNLIIWEKSKNKGIESYNIYKLIGNQYSIVGNVPFADLSVFEDLSSSPEVKADRYAISVIDTCGNESDYSPYHQTIYLGASKGLMPNEVVLDWTEYKDESGLFAPIWYYIYRGNKASNLILKDSVNSIIGTEWNDTNSLGDLYYRVSVKKLSPCDPLKLKASTGPFSQSISNLEDNRIKGSGIEENKMVISEIYPNPVNKFLFIRLATETNANYKIIDLTGQQILSGVLTDLTTKIDLTTLKNGLYTIQIFSDKLVQIEKIVKI